MKKLITITCGLLAASFNAQAQSAGSNVVELGWLHISPQDSSDLLSVAGNSIPDTGSRVSNSDTVGFTFKHFLTDNAAIEVVGGVPPKFQLYGTGVLSAAANNPLGNVRQWSPAVLAKYYFGNADSQWRPSVGLGISYIWFTSAHVNPAFQQLLSNQISAGQTTGLPTRAHIDSSWSAVFNTGLTYNLDAHWSASISVSYLPFGTKANLTTTLPTGASVPSSARITLDPIVGFLSAGYKF